MLYGVDLSHWNAADWTRDSKFWIVPQFALFKATEGRTYVDPNVRGFYESAKKHDILPGFYHYARPENNTPAEEAKHFYDVVASITNGKINEVLLALDWEGNALKEPLSWAREWLDLVYEATGIKPLFYCQRTFVKNCDIIAAGDNGLWIADWRAIEHREMDIFPWTVWAIRQVGNKPFDTDVFNGDFNQLKAYATPDGTEVV